MWDFTEAVKWFTSGEHPNYGFFLHGDAQEYQLVLLREVKEVKNRPALMVIYEKK